MVTLLSIMNDNELKELSKLPPLFSVEIHAICEKHFIDITVGDFVILSQKTNIFDYPFTDMLFVELFTRFSRVVKDNSNLLR